MRGGTLQLHSDTPDSTLSVGLQPGPHWRFAIHHNQLDRHHQLAGQRNTDKSSCRNLALCPHA
jgi:hypothetical protein